MPKIKNAKPAGVEINTDKICKPDEFVLRTTAVSRLIRHYGQSRVTAETIVERMIHRNVLIYAKDVGIMPGVASYTTEESQVFIFVEKK